MSTDANFLLLNNVLLKTLEVENYALSFQQVKEKVKPSLDQIVNSLKVISKQKTCNCFTVKHMIMKNSLSKKVKSKHFYYPWAIKIYNNNCTVDSSFREIFIK